MSFFGSIFKDIGKAVKTVANVGGDILTGHIANIPGDIVGGVKSIVAPSHSTPTPTPKPTAPMYFMPNSPIQNPAPAGGGNVSIPFLGNQFVPGTVGTVLHNAQQDLSNITGIPIAHPPALPAPGSTNGGVKTVIQHRAVIPGQVVVKYNGQYYAVSKEQARHLIDPVTGKRLWKPTPKPAITAHEMKVAREYKRVEKKLKSLGSKLDLKTEHKYKARRSSARRKPTNVQDAIIIKES